MTFAQWLGLGALLGLLVLLWQIRQIVLLVFGAIVLAVALDTLAQIPQRYGFRRGPSIAITGLTVLVGTILVGLIVVPPLADQLGRLFTDVVPDGIFQAQRLIETFILSLPTDIELPTLRELANSLVPQATELVRQARDFFSQSFTAFFATLLNLLFVIILTLLLLVNPQAYNRAFVSVFPAFYRPRIRYILKRCELALRGWLLGIMLTSTLVMLLSGIGLWILGVPLILANAVLAGVFNFIPNIGPTLSVFAPMLVALTDAPWKSLAVLGLYILIQQLESSVFTPIVMSRQVSLLPALTLVAQITSAFFFGVLGLFLAVPLAAIVQVWIQEVLIRDVLDPWQGSRTRALLMLDSGLDGSDSLQAPEESHPDLQPGSSAQEV
ncbi:AI-2E family transporter [Synechococcus sp. Nb3U1]|uniref:AI-2E family transporter n=1 Tax=Synechococcus sp. Nb3U1 TaxID=1914529 RepID=UPI001F35CB3B|nr:AI-2E family transporter [Synechococcus sp. Nb3U1]MCF2970714.1 AI-2E family transporter [Synechococcus sp. Nb3U1]